MTDVPSRRFPAVAITIVHALGPTWQYFITDDASQIIAFPVDRTVYLRFVRAGGAAPAIAVEIVDGDSHPVAMPPDPVIWLLPFDMAAATAARQIRGGLIAPYRSSLKAEAASAA